MHLVAEPRPASFFFNLSRALDMFISTLSRKKKIDTCSLWLIAGM
jgi:hypothetical protein